VGGRGGGGGGGGGGRAGGGGGRGRVRGEVGGGFNLNCSFIFNFFCLLNFKVYFTPERIILKNLTAKK